MVKDSINEECCSPSDSKSRSYKLESIVCIDDRGQMVLPKELRDRAGIHGGDKLAVISWEKGGKVCCMSLVKTDDFSEMVSGLIIPMVKEIIQD